MIEMPSLGMKNQPRQFGLLALFVLTTTVAVALAVIRLPIDPPWKFRLVVLIGCCFLYWANRKYREQRRAEISTTDKFYMGGVTLALLILLAVRYFWYYELTSNPFTDRVFICVGVAFVAIWQWFSIKRTWKLYFAPSSPDPPNKGS